MVNIPEVRLGLVAVSRDCFPIQLSENRRRAVAAAYPVNLTEIATVVENENDAMAALA